MNAVIVKLGSERLREFYSSMGSRGNQNRIWRSRDRLRMGIHCATSGSRKYLWFRKLERASRQRVLRTLAVNLGVTRQILATHPEVPRLLTRPAWERSGFRWSQTPR